MDPTVQAIVFAAAAVIWLIAFAAPPATGRYNLVALGLAVAIVVPLWNAIEAAG